MVAGSVIEKTNVPSRSACSFPKTLNRRSAAPTTKRMRKRWSAEGMGEQSNRKRVEGPMAETHLSGFKKMSVFGRLTDSRRKVLS